MIFLVRLGVFALSVSYTDLWSRTPYAELVKIDPTIESIMVNETIKPFQEEILELGLTLTIYAHYFTILRIFAGLPYFILSLLIIRSNSDRLMGVFFAMVMALLGAAGTCFTPLWEWLPESYPWKSPMVMLLNTMLFCGVILLYTYSDGQFVPRWTGWLSLLLLPYATAANFAPADSLLNPNNWPGPLSFLPALIFLGCGVFAMVYRYRHYADVVQKRQLKWFVIGSVLIVLNWFVDYTVWQIYPILTHNDLIQTARQAVLWELGQDSTWYLAELVFAVCIVVLFRSQLRKSIKETISCSKGKTSCASLYSSH